MTNQADQKKTGDNFEFGLILASVLLTGIFVGIATKNWYWGMATVMGICTMGGIHGAIMERAAKKVAKALTRKAEANQMPDPPPEHPPL